MVALLALSGAGLSHCFPETLRITWICSVSLGVLLTVHAALEKVPAAIVDAALQMILHTVPHMQNLFNCFVLSFLHVHWLICPPLSGAI